MRMIYLFLNLFCLDFIQMLMIIYSIIEPISINGVTDEYHR